MSGARNPEALYHKLGGLLAETPDLVAFDGDWNLPKATIEWLGQVSAVVHQAYPISVDPGRLDMASEALLKTMSPPANARQIMLILNRVLAKLEAEVPAATKGAFVAAGAEFDAFSAIAKILGDAKGDALIIDPYMDASTLTDFGGLVAEGVVLRLLTDEATFKPALEAAGNKWMGQRGSVRPLEIRLAPPRALHDRLVIIDKGEAWILTQSLKDFAKRAPATIQRADAELAEMKVKAFSDLWDKSKVLVA